MSAKLLVVELWGLGDLLIATPFLQAASQRFDVTLVAKPYALDLQPRCWKQVKVIPFVAPWTAFEDKYHLWSWPWGQMIRLWRRLAREHFDFGLSARWDPRDHFVLMAARARERLGYPRLQSEIFLTRPLVRPEPKSHRYEHWQTIARDLGFELAPKNRLPLITPGRTGDVLVHTGAGQPVRVWPLDRYRRLIQNLRDKGLQVQVACDHDQLAWWENAGEKQVASPHTVTELLNIIDRAAVFIGNDSGPGHLAAFCGCPTFTLFGPQLPEWFAPLHPAAEWVEGKACPYKPCSDYCQFLVPYCMINSSFEEVTGRIEAFLSRLNSGQNREPAALLAPA